MCLHYVEQSRVHVYVLVRACEHTCVVPHPAGRDTTRPALVNYRQLVKLSVFLVHFKVSPGTVMAALLQSEHASGMRR